MHGEEDNRSYVELKGKHCGVSSILARGGGYR